MSPVVWADSETKLLGSVGVAFSVDVIVSVYVLIFVDVVLFRQERPSRPPALKASQTVQALGVQIWARPGHHMWLWAQKGLAE